MAVDPPFRIKNMMPGMIMLWYGAADAIPSGWVICDGNNNTPNLVSKFVIGAKLGGPGYAVGATGGSKNHSHPFTGDGHAHNIAEGSYINDVYPDGEYGHGTEGSPATGDTDSVEGQPPFHALCYIMKTPIP